MRTMSLLDTKQQRIAAGLIVVLVIVLGVASSNRSRNPAPWNYVSSLLGWGYFFAWSTSFYMQLVLNFKRKSADGLSTDFLWFNLFGFSCYATYSLGFFAIPSVQDAYRQRNDGKENLVTINDVFFTVHACAITALTIAQVYCLKYKREIVSTSCKLVCVMIGVSIVVVACISEVIDTLYYISFVKIFLSIIKYCPQVYMNCKRRSTAGWSIANILLDFTGGSLSVLQLLVDGGSTHNWAGVVGNPVKFGLGFFSMAFDMIFMVQHYLLFPQYTITSDDEQESDELMLG